MDDVGQPDVLITGHGVADTDTVEDVLQLPCGNHM